MAFQGGYVGSTIEAPAAGREEDSAWLSVSVGTGSARRAGAWSDGSFVVAPRGGVSAEL